MNRSEGIARVPMARSSRARLNARSRRLVLGSSGIIALIVAWQLSVPLVGLENYLYPSPVDVGRAFVDLVRKGVLPSYIADSAGRYLFGMSVGVLFGVLFGVLIGLSSFFSRLLSPFINFMFAIVEVAWIPIFVIWWGYGLKTIIMVLAYVAFFPVLYNTILGMRTVPLPMINAARSLGASRLQVLTEVMLPAALPNIITGFRVGAGFAFRGLIFSETIAATSGVGYLIFEGATNQETANTIVGMIVIGLSWLFIETFYVKPLERATVGNWSLELNSDAGGGNE